MTLINWSHGGSGPGVPHMVHVRGPTWSHAVPRTRSHAVPRGPTRSHRRPPCPSAVRVMTGLQRNSGITLQLK